MFHIQFIIMLMKKLAEQSIENCLTAISWITHLIFKAFWVLVEYYSW